MAKASYMTRHRTICSVLVEIEELNTEKYADTRLSKLVEEALTYARRMDARLTEIRYKENMEKKDG